MEEVKNRELRTITTLSAPLEKVWEVWTDPERIAHWWGPKGFTTTILQMDFREGGEWKLTLHGSDGTNFPNRSVFREIIPFEKIVFEHFNPHFITTVHFQPEGNATQLEWSMLFDSEAQFELIVKAHKADKGQEENIEKLRTYLSELG